MVKYTGGPCGISKHNLKHFSRFFESVVKCGVSKQNLKHFSRFCSKFGDNPNKNRPRIRTRRHWISDLVGVLRRFWEFPDPEIGFRPPPGHKSKRVGEIDPFRTIWVSLPRVEIVPRTNPLVLLPFWLCHWVQVDGHVCFSVRNMTRDKHHVSKQNIPEYSS